LNKELIIKSIKVLEKKLKRRPVKRDNHSLYFAARKHFGTWNNAMKIAGYEILERQNPILPKKLTPELSYFLGLLLTDGHLQVDRSFKLSLYTSYEEEVGVICSLIKLLFEYKPGVYPRKTGFSRRINYDIYISSKEVIESLENNFEVPIGAKSLTLKMPKFIFNTSKENIGSFLRGIIDGDGSVKGWSVAIASGSDSFLKSLRIILSDFNIESKIYKDRTCMILNITKQENLKKLYSLIYNKPSFYYPRKKDKFETVIFKSS